MKNLTKFNNYLLLLLSAYVPFFTTFKFKYAFAFGSFESLYIELIIYSIILLIAGNKSPAGNKIGKITLSFLLFFVVQVISGIFSNSPDLAYEKIYVEFQFLVIFLVVNAIILDEESYESIFKGLLIGFVLSVIIAVLQKQGIKASYLFSEKELNANTEVALAAVQKDRVIRIWGPFGNSLTFSEYLSIVGVMLYAYYRLIKRNFVFAVLVLIMAFVGIFLTVGRTALFAFGFSFLLLEFLSAKESSRKNILALMVFLGILLVGLLLFLPGIQDNGNPMINRFSNASQDLKEGRLNLWVKGFQAFSKNILVGVGPGNLHFALSSEGFPMTSKLIQQFDGQHVENYFLTILYTSGIIGFYFLSRLFFYLVRNSYMLFKLLNKKIKTNAYGGLMLPAVVALIINSITNPALIFDQRIKMLFVLICVVINNSFLLYQKAEFFNKDSILRNLLFGRLFHKKNRLNNNTHENSSVA